LKRQAASLGGPQGKDLMNVLGHMQNYMWRKNDNLGGITNSIGWLTTGPSKERMLNYMKDYFERGMMRVRSVDTIEEMKSIVRDGGSIQAGGRGKDDRVIATALASAAYAEQLWPRLVQMKITRENNRAQDNMRPEDVQGSRAVSTYLKRIGLYS
jgi:hypothetical protein